MKKLTIITAGLMLFFGTTASASWGGGEKKSNNDGPVATSTLADASISVSKEVSRSFAAKFSAAENVSWKQKEEFFFVDFKVNQQAMFAAYNPAGELLGISRNVTLSQLPMHVEMSIRDTYKDYKIANIVTEMVYDGETTYHLQVENKARYLKLKVDSNGQITVEKRTKKKLIGSVY